MSPVAPVSGLEDRSAPPHVAKAVSQRMKPGVGEVILVGGGPGDPELLTLKALRALQSADIVFHDALIAPDILDLIPAHVDRVYVGKRKAAHAVPQTEIIARMAATAHRGLRVVRLKGGDPFIFGRGGEEVEGLEAAGVPVSVVPGISSAQGCAASARIPLTHRDCSQVVSFITGHARNGVPDINWSQHASSNETLVVFMGVGTAGILSAKLIDAGRAASTPIAVIENGTRPDERILRGFLSNLEGIIARNDVTGPALLIIGDVARQAVQNIASIAEEAAA